MALEPIVEKIKNFFRGAATTTVTTVLYTVPTNKTSRIKSVLIVNNAATSATFDLDFDGVKIATTEPIPASSTVIMDMDQSLTSGKIIHGGASAVTVNFHISGTETV